MLIVNNSMPKSGSSLLRHFVVEMIRCVNFDGQELLFQEITNGRIRGQGKYIPNLNKDIVCKILEMSKKHGPILIKAHLVYSEENARMLDNDEIIVTYNYRDPRDMILSAVDHHHRARAMGQNDFWQFESIEKAIPETVHWAKQAVLWKQSPITYDISYKYFLKNKLAVLKHINRFAGFNLSEVILQNIIDQEVQERKPGKNQFNKGLESRYMNEMSPQDLELCNSALKGYIKYLTEDF